MANTFLSKVVAERAALGVINRAFSGNRQLSGLSLPAIEYWRSKIPFPADHHLIQTLMRIAALAQTLSNKSNESFVPLTPEVTTTLDRLMEQLAEQVKALYGEGK